MVAKVKINNKARAKKKSDIRISKANYEFDVYGDVWRLDANQTLNLKLLESLYLESKFEKNFRLALADYASEFSSSYVRAIYVVFRHIVETGHKDIVTEEHIINFKATLTKDTEYRLGYIRAFLLDWHDKEIKGIDDKAAALLTSLTLSGNVKGKSVAIGCPYSGAYTMDEQASFIHWYINAYTDKLITLEDYAFIMALQQTGARPIQISYLYYGDIIIRVEGDVEYFDLKLPHAKKRGQKIRASFQTKEDVSEDLAVVLNAQARQSIKSIEAQFNIKLTPEQKKHIPIFIHMDEVSNCSSFDEFLRLQHKKNDVFALRKNTIAAIMRHIAHLCPLKTSRINIDGQLGDLHINPRRFRYTHATNMAILGASDIAIAQELGHADTQSVGVYTEFKEEIADRIDEALAPSLVPLAQAFSGTLIDSEKDAIRANDPRSRINNDGGDSVGNCGSFGFCTNGSVHCYTCTKFQPWLNAPHERVLESVMAERDRKRNLGASDFVLQGQNRSIEAIKVVIQRCEQRKVELIKEGALNV